MSKRSIPNYLRIQRENGSWRRTTKRSAIKAKWITDISVVSQQLVSQEYSRLRSAKASSYLIRARGHQNCIATPKLKISSDQDRWRTSTFATLPWKLGWDGFKVDCSNTGNGKRASPDNILGSCPAMGTHAPGVQECLWVMCFHEMPNADILQSPLHPGSIITTQRFPWQAAVEKTSFKVPLGPRDWSGSLVRKRSCTRSRSLIPGAMVTLEYLGFMDLDSEIQTRDWRFRQRCGFTETHPRCKNVQDEHGLHLMLLSCSERHKDWLCHIHTNWTDF